MVYFVKGKYRAYSIFMGERGRENCYDYETIVDCDPLKLHDALYKNIIQMIIQQLQQLKPKLLLN